MPFDSLGRYSPTHKVWDHAGNLIPDIDVSEGQLPAFPFKPAAWLPVQFYDKYFEDWLVVLPGKLVALDPDGRVMPAHYGLTSATVTYTANDITAGTIDIRTGVACVSADAVALSTIDGSTYGFMGRAGISFADSTVKQPIGVAPYAYCKWAGDASEYDDGTNPSGFVAHNYNQQSQVAVLCDRVIKLPLVPGQVATESMPTNWTSSTITFGTKSIQNRTYIRTTGRYSSTGYMPVSSTANVAAIVLDNKPVAKNTTRTPISSTQSGMLSVEVGSVDAVTVAGQFFVDYEVGVLFVYSSGGSTLPVTGAQTVTYFHYASSPSVYSIFAAVLATTSELVPGEYLKCGSDSNWVRVAVSASTLPGEICGQVLGFITEPQSGLEYVKTAFNPALRTNATGAMSNATLATSSVGLGQMDQMPGSATGGVSDNVHYAGAADRMVIVNIIGR